MNDLEIRDFRSQPDKVRAFRHGLINYYADVGLQRRRPEQRPSAIIERLTKDHPLADDAPANVQALLANLLEDVKPKLPDEAAVAQFHAMGEGVDALWIDLFDIPTLVMTSPKAVRLALAHSPELFGPTDLVRRAMWEFQPRAVAASSHAEDFEARRKLNEAVLEPHRGVHSFAKGFLGHVESAVDRCKPCNGELTFAAIEAVVSDFTGPIVWGAKGGQFSKDLSTLSARANWVPLLEPALDALESIIPTRAHRTALVTFIARALDPSLGEEIEAYFRPSKTERDNLLEEMAKEQTRIARCSPKAREQPLLAKLSQALIDSLDGTKGCKHQVAIEQSPHWLFAMKGTVSVTTLYTLALLANHEEDQLRVRQEVENADLRCPATFDDPTKLAHLDRCIREAGRLFPIVPMVFRNVVKPPCKDLGFPPELDEGMRIMIHHAANHRNPRFVGKNPHQFNPCRWGGPDDAAGKSWCQTESAQTLFAPIFGSGPRQCPGRNLGIMLTKACVGQLLEKYGSMKGSSLDATAPQACGGSGLPVVQDQFDLTIKVEDPPQRRPA